MAPGSHGAGGAAGRGPPPGPRRAGPRAGGPGRSRPLDLGGPSPWRSPASAGGGGRTCEARGVIQ